MVTSGPWVLTLKGGAQERKGFGCRCKRAEPAIREGWVGLGEMGAATLPCDHAHHLLFSTSLCTEDLSYSSLSGPICFGESLVAMLYDTHSVHPGLLLNWCRIQEAGPIPTVETEAGGCRDRLGGAKRGLG